MRALPLTGIACSSWTTRDTSTQPRYQLTFHHYGDPASTCPPASQLLTRSRAREIDWLLPRLSALAYQPIDSENGEIRLVELLPGCYDDVIRMNLHTKNLSDKPNYTALSYAWGTAPSSNRAIISGCPIPVRESLDLGLRRLRFTNNPRMLWIDALCINQNDLQERSHQVQQMATIYRYAKSVTIWLGEWPHLDLCPDSQDCSRKWMRCLDAARTNWYRAVDPSHHLCQHALEISKLPWFRRLWIIQEFLLGSRRPTMMLGSDVSSADDFFSSMRRCLKIMFDQPDTAASERKQADESLTHFTMLQEMESYFLKRGGTSLYVYSAFSRFSTATDPRDRIYGLLGIAKPYVAEPIVPDYSKAWSQVLAEATIVMVSEDGLFPYMSDEFAFPSTDEPEDRYRAPSWVLDFSQSRSNKGPTYFSNYNFHRLGSEGIERRRKSLRLSDDFRILYKYGWYVGTIKETFDFMTTQVLVHKESVTKPEARLYDFYHEVLQPKGITPSCLCEALQARLCYGGSLDKFTSSLLDHRDGFLTSFKFVQFPGYKFTIFLTEEGDVGITWLGNTPEMRKDDVLVALFERQMPFVLRPVQRDSTYRMVNLAYVSGRSGEFSRLYWQGDHGIDLGTHDWVYDAEKGCSEYAIV